MRRIVMAVMGTISGVALLFSYHTSTNRAAGTTGLTGTASASNGSSSSNGSGGSSGSGSSAGSGSSSSGSSGSTASGTFTGDTVGTRWGDVQVQITVENGKVTKSTAIIYPQENPRDVEINNYALPILDQEAVQQQSGNIDFVSGASVTSQGYAQSLQSAIDQAFA